MGKDDKISPSVEHKNLQEYLIDKTPRNVALAQSFTSLSPDFHLAFTLFEEIKARVENSQNTETVIAGLSNTDRDFYYAMIGLEKWLIMASSMTPRRQNIERKLIEVLEKMGSVTYHIQQKGGLQMPSSPMERG